MKGGSAVVVGLGLIRTIWDVEDRVNKQTVRRGTLDGGVTQQEGYRPSAATMTASSDGILKIENMEPFPTDGSAQSLYCGRRGYATTQLSIYSF